MSRAAILMMALLSGCVQKIDGPNGGPNDVPNDGLLAIGNYTYRDVRTGCEWFSSNNGWTPRTDASGQQICRRQP